MSIDKTTELISPRSEENANSLEQRRPPSPESEQKQFNTWVSFQLAEQPLWSVFGQRQ